MSKLPQSVRSLLGTAVEDLPLHDEREAYGGLGPLLLNARTGRENMVRSVWPSTLEECNECERDVEARTIVLEASAHDMVELESSDLLWWSVRDCPYCGPQWTVGTGRRYEGKVD
jgi:hypothetical protein